MTIPSVIYSVAYLETRADDPMIRRFRDWLFEEVAHAQDSLGHMSAAE